MIDGSFSSKTRAAIYEVGSGRCIGCGATPISAQHRRARGKGGTRSALIGSPANGLPLCGDGVRGCHGWAEANPEHAERLGWRLAPGGDAYEEPFWTRFGWQRWQSDETGFHFVAYVDPDLDLDRPADRAAAVEALRTELATRGLS